MSDNEIGKFLIDLKTHEGMILYYSLKERFEYRLDNRQEIINRIALSIEQYVKQYPFVIIPQSSSDLLERVLQSIDVQFIIVPKNNIETIKEFTSQLSLQKKERLAHLERILTMDNGFKINLMKANQRVKYEPVLFQKIDIPPGKGLILDDSCFSGTTFRALKHIAPNCDYLTIFSK